MDKMISKITALAQNCDCGNHHNPISIKKIAVGNGILNEAVSFIEKHSYKKVKLVADTRTYQAAGEELSNYLTKAQVDFSTCFVQPDENNDVVADELSLVQVLLETSLDTEVMVAIGAGTIHDITRFCSTKMGIPFISIPTAPSVDGFTSLGAPLIVRGVKKTFQMSSPVALFADLTVLKNAPRKMIAAGFGDMIAKFTSLADWRFSHLVAGEPYCPLAAQITKDALDACVENADKIKKADEEGIRRLIEALIESGLAMLLFGQSHPASAGEHHLSHYWEMEFLRQGRPAVLHGAKVGVSTSLLAELYKKEFLLLLADSKEFKKMESNGENGEILKQIADHKEEIQAIYQAIPDSSKLCSLLEELGGESKPEQLGIDEELLLRALNEAHHLRDRFTVLKFLNEIVNVDHKLVSENV